jgi:transposase
MRPQPRSVQQGALKRQMYGRAGLDLLERRFLLAA